MTEWKITTSVEDKETVTKFEVTERFITLTQGENDIIALEKNEIEVLKEAIKKFDSLN